MIYFVYKFRVKKSGLFYVGITNNIDTRKVAHWSSIHMTAILSGRRSPTLPGYTKIAQSFPKDINYLYVRSMVLFTIIDIKDTKKDALELERLLIRKYTSHPKFLNVKLT